MKIIPSLRQKKRYILFSIVSDKTFSVSEIRSAVEDSIQSYFGILGKSKASPIFLSERCQDNQFVLKINHQYVDEAKAAVILIKKIKNEPIIIRSIITSGSLKKAGSSLK